MFNYAKTPSGGLFRTRTPLKRASVRSQEARPLDFEQEAEPLLALLYKKAKATGEWRHFLCVALGCYTMYRMNDWRHLKWSDVVDSDWRPLLEVAVSRERKTGKARTVVVSNNFRGHVKRAIELANPTDLSAFIFESPMKPGCPLSGRRFNQILERIAADYAMPHFSTHSLRKSGARQVFENLGGDFEALCTVQRLLNHSNSTTTLRYIGITTAKMNKATSTL